MAESDAPAVSELSDDDDENIENASRRGRSNGFFAAVLGIAMVVALASLGGWQGVRWYQQQQNRSAADEFVEAARQGALNLTTIDAADIDADVRRILDTSTGTFHDDFAQRSQPFIDVVKQAQSKTEGTVTAAGIESQAGAEAQVLVSVMVRTTNPGQPEQEPRSWRMRIKVNHDGENVKVSDVQFVP